MPAVNDPYTRNRDAKIIDPNTGRPWQVAEGVEPGFDLPHVWTFSSIIGAAWKTYWHGQQDDALANDPEYANAMERDPLVMSILQERTKATANREWDIKVDNDRDPAQKAMATGLKQIVNKIPHKRQMFSYMIEGAVWAGRVASELKYETREINLPSWQQPDQKIRVKVPIPVGHIPIDGDKLNWTYDGIPTIQVYNPKASAIPNSAVIAGTASRSIVLLGSWRNKFIIHSHEIRDAPYWMARRASSIYGLGVRHFIYWLSWLKRELLAMILTYAERTGMGLRIWKYQAGNPTSKAAVQEAAENQTDRTNLLLPVTMAPGGRPVEGVEFVESGSTIATLLMDILRKFDDDIERYIIGQSMSSSVDASGLGSEGIADFQANTKANLTEYDADNFGETMTADLVRKLALWCYPKELVEDGNPRFAFQVAPPSPEKILAAARAYFDMGGTLEDKSLRDVTGLPAPKPGDTVLSFMALQQAQTQLQTEAAGQQAQQQAALGMQPGAEGQQPGGEPGAEEEPTDDDYESVMNQLVGEQSKNSRDGEPERYDRLKGGKGDDLPDSRFDANSLGKGMRVEKEHTSNPKIAKEIAKDHLSEMGDYYDKLQAMERPRHHAALLHHHLGEQAAVALHHLMQRLKADPQSARLHAAAAQIRDNLEPNDDDHEEVRQRILGANPRNGHPARFSMPSIVRDLDAAEKARNKPQSMPHEDIAHEAMRRLGDDAHTKAAEVRDDLAREAESDHRRHHPRIVADRVAKHIASRMVPQNR